MATNPKSATRVKMNASEMPLLALALLSTGRVFRRIEKTNFGHLERFTPPLDQHLSTGIPARHVECLWNKWNARDNVHGALYALQLGRVFSRAHDPWLRVQQPNVQAVLLHGPGAGFVENFDLDQESSFGDTYAVGLQARPFDEGL